MNDALTCCLTKRHCLSEILFFPSLCSRSQIVLTCVAVLASWTWCRLCLDGSRKHCGAHNTSNLAQVKRLMDLWCPLTLSCRLAKATWSRQGIRLCQRDTNFWVGYCRDSREGVATTGAGSAVIGLKGPHWCYQPIGNWKQRAGSIAAYLCPIVARNKTDSSGTQSCF